MTGVPDRATIDSPWGTQIEMNKTDASDEGAPYDDLFLRAVVASGLVSSTQLQLVEDIHESLAESGTRVPFCVILLRRGYITLSQANQILREMPERLVYCDRCQEHALLKREDIRQESVCCEGCAIELAISPADLLALDDDEEGNEEPVAARDGLIGQEVKGFAIDALIEEGHYRGWYHAAHLQTGKEIVLSSVPPEYRRSRELFKQLREDFYRVRLVNNPCKPDSFDLVQVDGSPYVTQAPLPGRSLETIVAQDGPTDLDTMIKLMTPVAEICVAGHRLDLIDFDLNPAMIIVDEYMRPRLMDVSTGFLHSDDVSMLRYRAPERIAHLPINEPADIYSFCTVGYFLLTGAPPFPGEDVLEVGEAIMRGGHRPIQEALPGLLTPIAELITKGLSPDPSARQQDFKEILDNLRLQTETRRKEADTVVPSSSTRKFAAPRLSPTSTDTVRVERVETLAPPEEHVPEDDDARKVKQGLQQIAEYGKRARDFMKLKRYTLAVKALTRILDYDGQAPEFDNEVANARKAIGLLTQQKERG